MYKLSYFTEEDAGRVFAFMRENPFAIIAGTGENYPVATHVPLDIRKVDGDIILTGHMMRNTDHHKAFLNNDHVLVIFNGPHCYVSASWYNNPAVASTWNYMTVHAKGRITFTDEAGTVDIIRNITNAYEDTGSTASFSALPAGYVDRLVKAITGFTIRVASFDNVFKLSQNHEEGTRRSIIKNLREREDESGKKIAAEMEKRITH